MDVSQWRGAHSIWPCFINILEHSECSGGSPGALYLNNIILYIDIYVLYIITAKSCGRYNESQTTGSGSLTSLVLPLPHQSVVQTEPPHGRERDYCPCLNNGQRVIYIGGVAQWAPGASLRRWSALPIYITRCPLPLPSPLPRHRHGQRGYDGESKPKFLFPNSFSTMAEITSTTSLVVEVISICQNFCGRL